MKAPSLIFFLVLSAYGCEVQECPQYWHLFRGNCYRYFGDRVTWSEAEQACNNHFTTRGMARLVSIADEEENIFVYKLFRGCAGDTPDHGTNAPISGVWLGLHQEVNDGPWTYTDGSSPTYLNWKPDQPNDYANNENCAHIWRDNDSADTRYWWNDFTCSGTVPYVCKMSSDMQ